MGKIGRKVKKLNIFSFSYIGKIRDENRFPIKRKYFSYVEINSICS